MPFLFLFFCGKRLREISKFSFHYSSTKLYNLGEFGSTSQLKIAFGIDPSKVRTFFDIQILSVQHYSRKQGLLSEKASNRSLYAAFALVNEFCVNSFSNNWFSFQKLGKQ